jgi:anti-sigma regulatory factor (Ser/Thr protein kinase)
VHDPGTACSGELQLPHDLSAVREARRALLDDLAAQPLDELLLVDAEVVMAELVTNACEHGTGEAGSVIEVGWCLRDECLEISVADDGSVDGLAADHPDPERDGGRGLFMVDALCERWHLEPGPRIRVVAELGLVRPAY